MADFQAELNQFMAGLRREESGSYQGNYSVVNKIGAAGAYQYMPGTWRSWAGPALAKEYPTANLAPPEIQDEVARRNITALFQKFNGNWNYVAQAWLAGPGGVGKHRSDGNVTTDQYAARVLGFAGLGAGGTGAVPVDYSATSSGSTPTDAAAMGADAVPAADDRHNLGNQLQSFLDMLGVSGTGDTTTNQPAQPDPAAVVEQRMGVAS